MHFWWFQDFSEICILPWENAYLFAFRLAAENAYFIFRWFCQKTNVFMELCMFDGSMKTLVFGQNQQNMKYAFSAASRKAKKICIFPWKNAYFWKILEPSKMHIENAYFLRAIKNAYWKCIFFACYFYGRSKMHNGSGRPTFLICTVSPKAVLWRFFSACFSLRHLNVTQQVWQQILIPALQSQLEPSVPYSGTLKDMDLHGLSSIQT